MDSLAQLRPYYSLHLLHYREGIEGLIAFKLKYFPLGTKVRIHCLCIEPVFDDGTVSHGSGWPDDLLCVKVGTDYKTVSIENLERL